MKKFGKLCIISLIAICLLSLKTGFISSKEKNKKTDKEKTQKNTVAKKNTIKDKKPKAATDKKKTNKEKTQKNTVAKKDTIKDKKQKAATDKKKTDKKEKEEPKKLKTTVPAPQKAPPLPTTQTPKKTTKKKTPEKKKKEKGKKADKDKKQPTKKMSLNDVYKYIRAFILMGGDNDIIDFLKASCPATNIVEVIKQTIEEPTSSLTRENKLNIIFSMAKFYKKNIKLQHELFDLIATRDELLSPEPPLIIVASKTRNRKAIAELIEWDKKKTGKEKSDLYERALLYAAQHDDKRALKGLHKHGTKINKDTASKLLFDLIKSNAGTKSIPFLLKRSKNNINYEDPKSKATLLIRAIKNKNIAVVKALIEAGADITLDSSDKSIGAPLQVARDMVSQDRGRKALDIELYLRKKGARDTD